MMCDKSECAKSKLSPCSLGAALGVVKGFCLMFAAWASMWGYGIPMVDHVAKFYHGYGSSFVGGLIGLGYGLVAGFVFGFVLGYVYNYFLCRCCKKSDAA